MVFVLNYIIRKGLDLRIRAYQHGLMAKTTMAQVFADVPYWRRRVLRCLSNRISISSRTLGV